MIDLTHPRFLLLLLAVLPLLIVGARRSLAGLTRLQSLVCLALRFLILLLLVLALAGVRLLLRADNLNVIFAIDQSASISADAARQARAFVASSLPAARAGDRTGIIGFASQPDLLQPPVESLRLSADWPALKSRTGTDLGGALAYAGAFFDADSNNRVVLLSDGNDTQGRAALVARKLAERGIELMTVPLENPLTPEVLVDDVTIPRRLKEGEPFDLTANVVSSTETKAKVKLYQNQLLIETREVSLKPGSNPFRATNLKAEGSLPTFEVEVVAPQDTALENNRSRAVASLRGRPRVLLVDSDESKLLPLADALRGENIGVEIRGALGAPRTLEDLQQFDLFMLSDLSALSLGGEQMELYRRWVQDFGGGFVMLGGENSFGVGGYYRTPIEEMLPVRMEHDDRQDIPSVALLVILDRSGSMSAQVEGQTKMSLANQGAVYALNVLQPRDYFGLLAVDVAAHSVAPLQQHSSKAPVEQKILSITAGGGGIYIYTSLAEAFQLLREAPARIKHVILFSDAADAEEKVAGEMSDGSKGSGSSLDLAAAMLGAKITTSVVALGLESDKDTAFLRQLAERGNGRFYLTSDATTLPQIFSAETIKVAQSSLVEEPFQAVVSGKSALIAGIDWSQSPLLLGYNSTKAKPTADILLSTEHGEPLFASWRYGLGQTAAFTSDAKTRWAPEWLSWPGFGKFWTQVVRGLMRKSEQAAFSVNTHESAGQLAIEIDAVKPDGAFRNRLALSVNALSPGQDALTLIPVQSASGRYVTNFDLPEEGTTMFSIQSPELPDGGAVFGHTRSYPREFLLTGTNRDALKSLAQTGSGTYSPAPAAVFARPAHPARIRYDLTRWLLITALVLFPLDIWLRRRTWG